MDNKRISKALIALLASAVVVASGAAALPANAASSSTTASSVSATAASKLSVSFSALSPYIISNTQSFAVAASINEGTAPYTYKFGYIKDGKTTYVKTVTTSAPYYKYDYKKFTEAGVYTPFVEVVDGEGARRTVKQADVTVKDLQICFGKAGANIIDKSQAFQATTSVGGGDGEYTYRYGYIKDGVSKTVKTIKTPAPYTTYTYKFTEAGVYTPFVEVVDGEGARRTVKQADVTGVYTPFVEVVDGEGARRTVKQADVTVKDFKVDFGAVSSYKIRKTQAFQTTASLSNGSGTYTYRFGYIQNGSKTYFDAQRTASPYMTYVYKFPAKGTYIPFVEVMDGQSLYASAKLAAVTVTD